jgi:Dual-action HEIGH metallo-peptidase
MRLVSCLLSSCLLLSLASCDLTSGEGALAPAPTWEEFRATVYQEADTGIFIVDGDTPLESEAQLRHFFDRNIAAWAANARGERPLSERQSPLIINRVGAADDRWAHTQTRNLTYCVSTTFGANYAAVANAMRQAAADWQAQANVYYRHLSNLDGTCNAATPGVVFDVNPVTGTSYIARAFFPSYARANRNVLINTAYVPNGSGVWSLRGVLRHELGHTLGFRHEHTRPEAGTCFEDNNWRALTAYDAASVMHYPQCRGTQTGDLAITGQDAAGARAVYGPLPARGADVVDYLHRHGDLINAFGASNYGAAASHWVNTGVGEGRRGAAEFDGAYYLGRYGDLLAAFGATNYPAARNHWLIAGIVEGRRAAREFDAAFYLSYNTDVGAAYGASNYSGALDHWLTVGINEGRRSAADFDVRAYLARYPDLRAAYGDSNYAAALFHWQTAGAREGRNPAP